MTFAQAALKLSVLLVLEHHTVILRHTQSEFGELAKVGFGDR